LETNLRRRKYHQYFGQNLGIFEPKFGLFEILIQYNKEKKEGEENNGDPAGKKRQFNVITTSI